MKEAGQPNVQLIVYESFMLPYGPARVALLEEAVRLADAQKDLELGFWVRTVLIDAATFSGRTDLAIVAMGWCLAQSDADPEKFPVDELLWKYKWVVQDASGYPDIPAKQVKGLLEDLRKRFTANGSNLQPYHFLRRSIAQGNGDAVEAKAAHADWKRTPADVLSDCLACVTSDAVRYELFCNRFDAAIRLAKPLLDGKQRCATVPHYIFAQLLIPLLKKGRGEEAADLHRRGWRLIQSNIDSFTSPLGDHLKFLTLTGNLDRARRLFEKHAGRGYRAVKGSDRLQFLRAAIVLLAGLEKAEVERVRLREPAAVELESADGRLKVAELLEWTRKQATALAKAFDKRNGNSYHADQIKADARLGRYATELPV
ncbi:MAG: hypothetical protein K1X57_02160 [Gemmataceae bacterium]|nr:hypothetical protein [Gemmataceae bacterium]